MSPRRLECPPGQQISRVFRESVWQRHGLEVSAQHGHVGPPES